MTHAENPTSKLLLRALGLSLLLLFFLFFEPGHTSLMQRLLWPGVAIVGAALVLRNVLVLALTVAFFATLNSEPGSSDLFTGWVYPLLAGAAGLLILVVLATRFRAHIRATRTRRWAPRTPDSDSGTDVK